jgi:orotidine-5'-phosphate decarboxylase
MSSPIYRRDRHARHGPRPAIAAAVKRHAGGLKLGLEFFCHNGRHGVLELAELGLPIFLDLKLHDIPNTVAKAVQALAPITPAVLTVHAAGGRAMLEDAKAALRRDQGGRGHRADQPRRRRPRRDRRQRQQPQPGRAARGAGAGSRARRHRLLRQRSRGARRKWKDGFFVVPGIRRPMPRRRPEAGDDPRAAIDAGASILVIGRPVTGRRASRRGAPGDRFDALSGQAARRAYLARHML